jgi:hypothetical protein
MIVPSYQTLHKFYSRNTTIKFVKRCTTHLCCDNYPLLYKIPGSNKPLYCLSQIHLWYLSVNIATLNQKSNYKSSSSCVSIIPSKPHEAYQSIDKAAFHLSLFNYTFNVFLIVYCILSSASSNVQNIALLFYIQSQIPFFPFSLLSSPLLSYPIVSYPILPYPILSYPTLSYPILSYPILHYPIFPFLSSPLLNLT